MNAVAKHTHTVSVNTKKSTSQSFTYNFGHTKNITIVVGKDYFSITADLNRLYDKDEMLSKDGYLFPDAIKKAMLLHLLLYSKSISVKSMTVQIDDDIDTITKDNSDSSTLVYSMVADKLIHPIDTKWTDVEISELLSQTKSKYDSRMSALFAFICSKSKHYEAERFMYLWMSFNGLYNYFSSIVSTTHNNQKIRKECNQLRYFQLLFGWGNETLKEDKEKHRLADGVTALVKRMSMPVTLATFSDVNSPLTAGIDKLLEIPATSNKYNLTSQGYFLTQYAYYHRCKLFHADKPVALFCFADEEDIVCLRAINNVMEEFIDQNLHMWFSKSYVDENLYPKAAKMEIIR